MNTLELLVIKILVFLKNKKKQFKLKKNLNNSSLRYFNHNNFVIKILVFLKNKKKQFKLKKINNLSLRYFNHNNFVIKILVFLIKQFKHHIIIKLVRVYR